MTLIQDIEELAKRAIRLDLPPQPVGAHTVVSISMTDGDERPDKVNRLICSCGLRLRRRTAQELAEAYANHTGVASEEVME